MACAGDHQGPKHRRCDSGGPGQQSDRDETDEAAPGDKNRQIGAEVYCVGKFSACGRRCDVLLGLGHQLARFFYHGLLIGGSKSRPLSLVVPLTMDGLFFIDCSLSRNSSVPARASTLLRTNCGRMKMMISVRCLLLSVLPNKPPMIWMSVRPGTPERLLWSLSLMRPPSRT